MNSPTQKTEWIFDAHILFQSKGLCSCSLCEPLLIPRSPAVAQWGWAASRRVLFAGLLRRFLLLGLPRNKERGSKWSLLGPWGWDPRSLWHETKFWWRILGNQPFRYILQRQKFLYLGCGVMQRVSGIPQGTCWIGDFPAQPWRSLFLCLRAEDLQADLLVGILTLSFLLCVIFSKLLVLYLSYFIHRIGMKEYLIYNAIWGLI